MSRRFRLRFVVWLPVLVWACAIAAGEPDGSPPLEKIGKIEHPPVLEASGLVASRRFSGVFWTVCDSGNLPHLFAVDRKGRLLGEYVVQDAVNLDWESIAVDDQGNLYIGDVGNNLRLPQRWVLRVAEPDPRQAEKDAPQERRPVQVDKTYYYSFDPAAFDVEGTFVWQGSLYLFSKVREKTSLYRLTLADDAGPQTLTKVCDVPGVTIVTGADITADGRRVAACSYREIVIFELRDAGVESLAGEPAQRIPFRAPAVESCAWDGDDLLLLSEDRSVYRLLRPRH